MPTLAACVVRLCPVLRSYGQFFLKWYSQSLISHGDAVLATAVKAFPGTSLAAKVAGEWLAVAPTKSPSCV